MMLRSSSTPVLGSLISSISESPNHHHHSHHHEVAPHTSNKHPRTALPPRHNKLSFHHSGSQNFTHFSGNSSPVSEISGIRRAQSEGNLQDLANAASNDDEFSLSVPTKKFPRRRNSSQLETIPSFSFCNSSGYEYEVSDEEEEEEEEEEHFENAITIEDKFEFSKFSELNSNEEMRYTNAYGNLAIQEDVRSVSPQMYLARGLGVGRIDIGFGSGGGSNDGGGASGGGGGGGDSGGDSNNLEEHYKKMVVENPGNPLFLRNYAQFLYQSKGDPEGAEEYYSRAILADPKDGEILSQYAKLVWELHRDEDRATSYFERAVQAASEDSHVHAAYAAFLWQVEEDEDEDEAPDYTHGVPPLLHQGAMVSATSY